MMRVVSVDVARGLLILYIVAVTHPIYWVEIFTDYPISRSFLLFGIPCLYVLTGYSYALSTQFSKRPKPLQSVRAYTQYLFARLSRMLIPYYVCSLAYAIAYVMFYKGSGPIPGGLQGLAMAYLNPLKNGDGYPMEWANSHFWFIRVYLQVTVVLPFITAIRIPFRIPLVVWMVVLALLTFALETSTIPGATKLMTGFCYSVWAVFGYQLATRPVKFRIRDYAPVFVVGLAFLIVVAFRFSPPLTLDMQFNKFPPNMVFFVFESTFLSLFLMITTVVGTGWADRLYGSFWLRPFITYGYTIYLWQGLGIAAGVSLGRRWNLPFFFEWCLMVSICVLLGLVVGPIEKIRFRRRSSKVAAQEKVIAGVGETG